MDNKKDIKRINLLIHRLGLKYKLSDKQIKEIVESPYEFAASKIKEIDLENVETVDEVTKMKTNFNFLGFGKLYFSEKLVNKKFKQRDNIKKINDKKWNK